MPAVPRWGPTAGASVLLIACTEGVWPRHPGRHMRDSTSRHAAQRTRTVIPLVSFFLVLRCVLPHRKRSFILAAVITYNTILTDLLSALLVAFTLHAIMASTHATALAWVRVRLVTISTSQGVLHDGKPYD